ncbi:MAG: chemotaxis protein CheX [Phycisphaerales bacterium]|jgi:CheY-specific phosphatase CheX
MIETENMLTDSLTQALETMAFLTIIPLEEEISAPENIALAEISFSGPTSGTIQILAGRDFCETLAENIGATMEADDETCYDALKELSNVTCGLLLPMLASSPADVFDLTVPIIKTGNDSPKWDDFTGQPEINILNVEGNLIATRLTINN